jgi:hypothetical protein
MQFTLDGESFELTPELVRRRIEGHIPEDVREYWVEIDGVRWPVKQAIALATGANRGRFQSQASRRWLQSLGFVIGAGSSSVTSTRSSRQVKAPARETFDPASLEEIEALDVRVGFSWLRAGAVTLDVSGLPLRHAHREPYTTQQDVTFGVDERGMRTLYIGESVQLARRASNYRNAKTDRSRQRTSRRIHKEIVSHLSTGGTIEFAIATSVRLGEDEALDLRLKSARRLAENAAVLLAQSGSDTRVLNIDAELGEDGEAE